jgi:hypothetical protein
MTTRRQALAGALCAGAGALALRVPAARAAGNDTALLEALLAYQQEAVFAYELALRSGPLRGRDREVLGNQRDQAAEAAVALRKAVVRSGGTPIAPRPPSTAQLPPEVARESDRRGYLHYIVSTEEAAVNGFYVALQALEEKKLVRGAAAFMAQGGRRLVVVRDLAGDPLLPRAFETGGG